MVLLPGTFRAGELGLVSNPVDYDPPPTAASTTLSADTVDTLIDGALTAVSPAEGGSFDVDSTTGFETPPTTTLAVDLDSSALEVELTDASGFDDAGVIKVNDERILYSAKVSNTLVGVTRASFGTTLADHTSGDQVDQPRVVIVEQERIAYHAKTATSIDDVVREAPVAHDDNAVCASNADISVASVTGMRSPGWVQIEDEEISYLSISGTDLQGVARACNGSTAAQHASSTAVTALGYARLSTLTQARKGVLYFLNGDSGTVSSGTFVGWLGTAGDGGGFQEIGEGEPMIGVLREDTVVGGWGVVQAGGIASALLDATYPEEPGPGEPIFAASSTTVKSLENVTSGDIAIGRCLRVHDYDYDGTTALTEKRVDFVVLSQLLAPYEEP